MTDNLCWVDIETTGLDPTDHTSILLEVGFIITTPDLEEVAEHAWVREFPARHLEDVRRATDPVVVEMHTASGLFEEAQGSDDNLVAFRDRMAATAEADRWLTRHGAYAMTWAGSSVHFDLRWLATRMPEMVRQRTAYRVVDVSSWREMLRRWRPELLEAEPEGERRHRALPDIRDSIALLAHYRKALGL